MEIQKIFSDQYDEERLYSVLMTEEELALFSEAMEEVEEPKKSSTGKKIAKGAGIAAGTVAALAAAGYGVKKGADAVNKKAVHDLVRGNVKNRKKAENLIKRSHKVSEKLGKVYDPVENAIKNLFKKGAKK